MAEIVILIIFNYSNYGSCKEVWKNLILHLCTDKLVSYNPFGLVCAAVIGEDGFAGAVPVLHFTISMAAAGRPRVAAAGTAVMADAFIFNSITCKRGYRFIGSAVNAGMMNEGKSEAA